MKTARNTVAFQTQMALHAKLTIYRVASMIAAYCNADTKIYQDENVYNSIHLGLMYIKNVQHENGLFDYITCNFYSAPDTAFCVKKLIPCYEFLLNSNDDKEKIICKKVEEIIRKGAVGLLEGGFHTPNHRWAIASVLMKCSRLFGIDELRYEADRYLNEGIDCNEDGEFSEKSAGNYNRINNDAMIMLSEVMGDTSYDQYAIRNLRMMLTYIEPDDSIFTANSTRFDKDRLIYPKDYYMEYLKMGTKYHIPEFLEMCNSIFDIVEKKNITSPDFLIFFMLNPEYRVIEYDGSYQFPDYNAFYKKSGIARARKDSFTYTVLNGKSNFLYVHNGTMKLEMKVAGSFCEHRAFISEHMEKMSDSEYHLSQVMKGWYYLPFDEKPETSDWWAMDNDARRKKYGPYMHIDVWVKEVQDGLDVRVKTSGVNGAPWRIELAFTGAAGMYLDGENKKLRGDEVILSKSDEIELYNESNSMIISGCFREHFFTDGKEDSELRNSVASTVYLTAFTEFDRIIKIRNKKLRII